MLTVQSIYAIVYDVFLYKKYDIVEIDILSLPQM